MPAVISTSGRILSYTNSTEGWRIPGQDIRSVRIEPRRTGGTEPDYWEVSTFIASRPEPYSFDLRTMPLNGAGRETGWTNTLNGARAAANTIMAIAGVPSSALVADGNYVDITVSANGTVWTINDGVVTAVKIDSESSTSGDVLTADGAGGASWQPSAGGGLPPDGDYGDITVSASGATWTIDADAVSNAKLANVPAATIKGSPVGAGTVNPIDLTANQTSTILDTATDPFLRTSAAPTGTVTAVSVASANGFAGSSSGGATPALTLSTTITGVLSGNGTAISAAPTTGTGKVVLETSPTLVTPNLGTPTSGTLTNCTGLPAANVINTPAGTISATDVQAAINELDTEKYPQSDIKRVVLTADSTPTTSATYVDVTGMVLTLEANTYYSFELAGAYQSANTGTGIGIAITTTGSPTFTLITSKFISNAGAAVGNQALMRTNDSGTIATAVTNINVNLSIQVRGYMYTGGTPATVQARIARGGASNNVFMAQGSYMRAEKVG